MALSSTEEVLSKVKSTRVHKHKHTHLKENQLLPYLFKSKSLKVKISGPTQFWLAGLPANQQNHVSMQEKKTHFNISGGLRKLCLPMPVGVAQAQSYWLLISQLWRPEKTGEGVGDVWKFVRIIRMSHEYSVLFALLLASFHHSSHKLTWGFRYTVVLTSPTQ